ncbi:MAG: hypothetical protein ACRDS9_13735 [Pseudonocardiaceae bacterium]
MTLFVAEGAVDAEVEIALYSTSPDDETISILFGEEQVTLVFFDVESLERLRDLADEAARRLRAVIEANAQVRAAKRKTKEVAAAADQPAELIGS